MEIQDSMEVKAQAWRQVLQFLLVFSGCLFFLAPITSISLAPLLGFGDAEHVSEIMGKMEKGEFQDLVNPLKIMVLVSNFMAFFLPVLIYVSYYKSGSANAFLKTNALPGLMPLLVAIALLAVAFPFISWTYSLNRGIFGYEGSDVDRAGAVLIMNTPTQFWLTLILLGVCAALFEELLFRGVLQQLLVKATGNQMQGILMSAALFTMLHGDVYGLLPRALLGVLFGWVFWRTQSIWTTILMHCLFNGVQIAAYYQMMQQGAAPQKAEDSIPWWLVLLSVALSAALIYWLQVKTPEPPLEEEPIIPTEEP